MKTVAASNPGATASMRRLGSGAGGTTTIPSRVHDKLASRNGPRHSVYWVQSHRTSACGALNSKRGTSTSRSPSDLGGMGASAGKIEYSVTGKYTGEWADGQKHGYGVFVYANHSKYEGEWVHDKRDGKGTFWVDDSATKKMRKQFAGDWRNDRRHGIGTFFMDDGARYDGLWERNKREGSGRMVYGDGSVYEGSWHQNQRSGHGVLILPNGDRYDGHWLHDKKDGPGRFYYKATGKIYEGEWVDGAPRCGTYHDADQRDVDDQDVDDDENGGLSVGDKHDRFHVPELGLAHPERVVSESIAYVRQERILERAFQSQHISGDPETRGHGEHGGHDNDHDDEETNGRAAGGSVVFDEATMKVLQHEFQSLERRDATIQCETLPQMLSALGLSLENDQILAFLDEIGATPETAISFADCVDILSLLAESAIIDGAQHHGDEDEELRDHEEAEDDEYE